MQQPIELTAVFENVENGWVQAQIAEMPGVITVAPTLDEARELLVDAFREYLLALGGTPERRDLAPGAHEQSIELLLTV
jgi:predicted RNase H-like HicB family nuclease